MTLTTLLRRTRQQHALAHHVTREVHPVEWRPLEHRWGPPAALALLCAALFFYGINIGELYRTEALRALIARGFLESGNWLVPTLYGEPLLTKPPVMYSAIAACGWFFGEITEWSARLPSALAATALVFLFYWYARRQLGSIGGLIVAAILPCGFLWLDKAAAAEIDMLQVAWTGAALLFFFRAAEACERPGVHGFGWWLAALLCVAGGALTKWTTPVFFYATAIGFLAWRKQLRLLIAWPHLLCGLIGAGVCFVWVAAVVHLVGFDTLYETIYMEAAPRLSHQLHDRSADVQLAETLSHPLKLLLVNLPWSAFALLTLWPGFFRLWDERGRRLLQAFHCWTWPNLLVWTFLPDHATRHSFPLFPGLVGLGAMVWVAFVTHRLPAPLYRWHVLLACLGLGVCGLGALAGTAAGLVVLPTSAWWLMLVFTAMAGWCVIEGLRACRVSRPGVLLLCAVLTWIICKFAFVHIFVPYRNGSREPQVKAAQLARHVPEGKTLYLFRLKDEGIMFYYGRPVLRLRGWEELPDQQDLVYCAVIEAERQHLQSRSDWEVVLEVPLVDEQGEPMILLGLRRRAPHISIAGRVPWPSACPAERRTTISSPDRLQPRNPPRS